MTIEEIKAMRYNDRLSYQAIADKVGLTRQRIHQILNYDTPVYRQKQREKRRKLQGVKKYYRTQYNPEGK